jgi:ABC-type uncharacterized transport system involved in gliding motility auxiliary subunit
MSAIIPQDRRALSIGSLILAAILFLAVLVFSTETFRNARLDLTEQKIYTLSDGTKEILSTLKEPVTLRFFLSRDLVEQSPQLKDYARTVQELLERYVGLSNGSLDLQIIYPEPFSPEEDRAVGFGLHGVPITQAGNLGYFGLAGTNTTDDVDVIPFFTLQRAAFLEYDLSRLVQNLASPQKKKVGIYSSLPVDADPVKRYRPWQIVEQLKEFFTVERVTLEDPVPEDIDLLLVIHPRDMDDVDRYYIDQYVMRGGKTMVFVDPYSEEATRGNAMQRQPPDTGSDLKKLFAAWGIEYDQEKVLGDRKGAQRVSAGNDALGRPIITDYLAWITLSGDQINKKDVATGELEQITLASAGYIGKKEGSNITFEPLLQSGVEAMGIPAAKIRKDPKPAELLKDFKSDGKRLAVAARISGVLKSAFPDGLPKDKIRDEIREAKIKKGEKVAAPLPHLAASKGPVNLLVVADTDMLADRFWMRQQDFFGQRVTVPIANNGDFVTNAVDNMAGSNALIGLRSRGVAERPFEKVQELRKQAELRYRAKEQGLLDKLKDIEAKLKDLQTKETKEGKTVILSADQKTAIENFRRESIAIRRELRDVQRALREDIDTLDARLKIINIGAMPALVVLFAIGLGIRRRRLAREHRAAALGQH